MTGQKGRLGKGCSFTPSGTNPPTTTTTAITMSNSIQRSAMLRAAQEAARTGALLRAPPTPRSHDPRATATTGYQSPEACWAPRRAVAPLTPAPARRQRQRSTHVTAQATTGFQVPDLCWAPARRGSMAAPPTVPDVDSDVSGSENSDSDEETTTMQLQHATCWLSCCSA